MTKDIHVQKGKENIYLKNGQQKAATISIPSLVRCTFHSDLHEHMEDQGGTQLELKVYQTYTSAVRKIND